LWVLLTPMGGSRQAGASGDELVEKVDGKAGRTFIARSERVEENQTSFLKAAYATGKPRFVWDGEDGWHPARAGVVIHSACFIGRVVRCNVSHGTCPLTHASLLATHMCQRRSCHYR
jgi:hypothetical protein